MRREFRACLKRRKISAFPEGRQLISKELRAARDDLGDAALGFENGRYKWSTIQGYYSMYHSARALIFSMGYRERSHYCLFVAIQELFVDRGLMEAHLAEAFFHSMQLRETADYESHFSKDSASTIIGTAREMLMKAEQILALK
jgi:uncharacterized protein (UPF0332 family)